MPATRAILEGLDLARYFGPALIVGGDGPHLRKPDPAGLRFLVEQAAVISADTLLVGDSEIDWQTAQKFAVPMILADYGFGSAGVDEATRRRCLGVLEQPLDLLAIL